MTGCINGQYPSYPGILHPDLEMQIKGDILSNYTVAMNLKNSM